MPPWSPVTFRQGATMLSGIFAARFFSSSGSGSSSVTSCSKRLVRPASPYAARESPTPLIFLQTPGVDWKEAARRPRGQENWQDWSAMFAEKGYTSVEIDVDVRTERSGTPEFGSRDENAAPSEQQQQQDKSDIELAAAELNQQIRLLAVPFAPVIIASGPSCLVAQTYVESYPASGLVMVDPPPDNDPRPNGVKDGGFEWPKFTYEPRFPILIVARKGDGQRIEDETRVGSAAKDGVGRGGKGVEVIEEVDGYGDKTRNEVERWLDRCGY